MDLIYLESDVVLIKEFYIEEDTTTWPYYPIVMPLKEGNGPATDKECDEITWEVWDRWCNTHGSFKYLTQAIKLSMELNRELLNEK